MACALLSHETRDYGDSSSSELVRAHMRLLVMSHSDSEDNAADREMPQGESGKLWLRLPSFSSEYHKSHVVVALVITLDGCFKPSDVGLLEGDQLLLVVRRKDILKTPDYVFESYIEGVLMECHESLDAGVKSVYEFTQELQNIQACVVQWSGSNLTESKLRIWIEQESADTAHLTPAWCVWMSRQRTLPRSY